MKQEKKWFFTISPCHIFQHRLCSHKALPWEEKIKFFESKHLGTRSLKGKPRCHCLFASFVCSFVTYYAISWDLEEMFKQSVSCDFLIELKHSMPDWVCCELKCIAVFIWLLLHQKMQTDVLDFFNVAQLLTREEEKNTRKGQMVDKREMSSESLWEGDWGNIAQQPIIWSLPGNLQVL